MPRKEEQTRTDARHRLAMTELAVNDDPRFAVSDCDIVREGATYTFDTVQIFRQQFPSAQLWWLLGSDSLLQLHTWKKWQTLVNQTHIAVAARQGDNIAQAPRELHGWIGSALQNGSLHLLQTPMYNISSTEIRRRLHAGESVNGLIDPQVENYIARNRLYR